MTKMSDNNENGSDRPASATVDNPSQSSSIDKNLTSDEGEGTKRKLGDADIEDTGNASTQPPIKLPKVPAVRNDEKSEWNQLTTVLVGRTEVSFQLHTHVLRKIPFFRGCLDSGMQEAQSGVVRLPADDWRAFKVAVHWLYWKELSYGAVGQKSALTHDKDGKFFLALRQSAAYQLADKLMMEDLQNAILDHFAVDPTKAYVFSSEFFDHIVAHAPQESPLHRLGLKLMAYFARHWGGVRNTTKDGKVNTVHTFAETNIQNMKFVAQALHDYAVIPNFRKRDCSFHKHDLTSKCGDRKTV
jgi:hypothetical protein